MWSWCWAPTASLHPHHSLQPVKQNLCADWSLLPQPWPPPTPHPVCVAAGAGTGKPTGSPSSLLSAVLSQPGFLFHSALAAHPACSLEGLCSSPPELGPWTPFAGQDTEEETGQGVETGHAARLRASHNSGRSKTSRSVSRTGQSLRFGEETESRPSEDPQARLCLSVPTTKAGWQHLHLLSHRPSCRQLTWQLSPTQDSDKTLERF